MSRERLTVWEGVKGIWEILVWTFDIATERLQNRNYRKLQKLLEAATITMTPGDYREDPVKVFRTLLNEVGEDKLALLNPRRRGKK